eukprot:3620179-Pleurochrysis_carterae.AAC.1
MASCSACGVVDYVVDRKIGDRGPDDSQMHILPDFKNARFLRAVAVSSAVTGRLTFAASTLASGPRAIGFEIHCFASACKVVKCRAVVTVATKLASRQKFTLTSMGEILFYMSWLCSTTSTW